MPDTKDFREVILNLFAVAEERGAVAVDIKAGKLHRSVGGYPGPNHRMPVCCEVMRRLMRTGDQIVAAPPRGNGASLTIRYVLPR